MMAVPALLASLRAAHAQEGWPPVFEAGRLTGAALRSRLVSSRSIKHRRLIGHLWIIIEAPSHLPDLLTAAKYGGTNDVFGFLVRQDSPIKSAKELEGKTVATNNVRNIIHAAGLHWIDANGGDSSKVKWVEIPFPQMTPALVNKQIDAFVALEPVLSAAPLLVSLKQARVLGHMLGGIAPRLLIASYFGSEAWIGKNVGTVKSFVTAINRGIDAHNANLEEARAMIAKYTGLKPEFLKEMPLPAFEKKLLESDLDPMLEVGVRYKFIDKKVAAGELISRHVHA